MEEFTVKLGLLWIRGRAAQNIGKKKKDDLVFSWIPKKKNLILFYDRIEDPSWILAIQMDGNVCGRLDTQHDTEEDPIIGAVRRDKDGCTTLLLRGGAKKKK